MTTDAKAGVAIVTHEDHRLTGFKTRKLISCFYVCLDVIFSVAEISVKHLLFIVVINSHWPCLCSLGVFGGLTIGQVGTSLITGVAYDGSLFTGGLCDYNRGCLLPEG